MFALAAIVVAGLTGTLATVQFEMAAAQHSATGEFVVQLGAADDRRLGKFVVQFGAADDLRLGKRAYDDLFGLVPAADLNAIPLPRQTQMQPTAQPAPKVVCGMLIIQADPSIDPRIAVDPQKAEKTGRLIHHALRLVRPPMCQPAQ